MDAGLHVSFTLRSISGEGDAPVHGSVREEVLLVRQDASITANGGRGGGGRKGGNMG